MRDCIDDYLGHFDFTGKTVLEVGPANGFHTVAMEKRGASVTCVENAPDQIWEYFPRVDRNVEEWARLRREGTPQFFRTWWYTQKVYGCSAKMLYCGAAALNDVANILKFDVCLIAGVLQHVQHPMDLVWAASRLADTVIITERWLPVVEEKAHGYAAFAPHPGNDVIDSWWCLSTAILKDAMNMFGFEMQREARFDVKAWRMAHPDINQDTSIQAPHYNMVFARRSAIKPE
jgi:hypothetical protein